MCQAYRLERAELDLNPRGTLSSPRVTTGCRALEALGREPREKPN